MPRRTSTLFARALTFEIERICCPSPPPHWCHRRRCCCHTFFTRPSEILYENGTLALFFTRHRLHAHFLTCHLFHAPFTCHRLHTHFHVPPFSCAPAASNTCQPNVGCARFCHPNLQSWSTRPSDCDDPWKTMALMVCLERQNILIPTYGTIINAST